MYLSEQTILFFIKTICLQDHSGTVNGGYWPLHKQLIWLMELLGGESVPAASGGFRYGGFQLIIKKLSEVSFGDDQEGIHLYC